MSADTKERVLQVGLDLVCTKSFHSVGLSEILAVANVPKGSFYHYFPSKEAFGVELIRHYADEGAAKWDPLLEPHTGLKPLDRLLTLMEAQIALMAEHGCRQSCLLVKLAAEVSQLSEPMRAEVVRIMAAWRSMWEKLIREGQESGDIRKDAPAEELTSFVQAAWLGAVVRAHVEQGASVLRRIKDGVRDYLAARP
jgi:TetR/AcrR family transcriptional regulator, transcriptional repressor for nem operon